MNNLLIYCKKVGRNSLEEIVTTTYNIFIELDSIIIIANTLLAFDHSDHKTYGIIYSNFHHKQTSATRNSKKLQLQATVDEQTLWF